MARSLPRRIALGLAIAAASLLGLAALLVVLVDSNVATRRAAEAVLPRLSSALGREVTLEDAHLRLFPNPRVRLAGLAVAGRPGEPPLVQAESLDVEVGLWPLLRSLGKDVEVRAFALVRPTVNLVKAKDGTWSHEGLGEASGARGGGAAAAGEEGGGARVAVETVRIEKATIRVIDRAAGADDAGVALSELDLEARGVGPGLPFDARLAAALADERQNLHAQLSVARLPAGVPRSAAEWPTVQGTVRLGALALERIRALLPGELGAIVRGGTVSLDAKLVTGDGPAYRVEGTGDLRDLSLRGQPASGRFRAALAWSPARPDAARADLTDVVLRGPGVDLGGHASLETSPLRAWFVLTGPLLDLDAVMGILPEGSAQAKAAPAPPKGELVPEATRRTIRAASARGTIAIGELRGGRLRATDVKARAVLSGGTLTLEDLDAQVFGGRVSGSGTRLSLAEREPTWRLAAKLSSLDLEQALGAFAGRSPLVGKVDGTLDVAGAGADWEAVRRAVTGLAALAVKDGSLTTTDLGDEVLGALSKGLEASGRGALAKRLSGTRGGKTTFKDLAGRFQVKDGFLTAQAPLAFRSDVGEVKVGGRIGLDGRLDLDGGVAVPKERLAQLVSGLPLPDALDVPLALGGTLGAPRVEVRAEEAARGIVSGQARQARKAVRGEAERAGRKAVEGLLDKLGGKKKQQAP